jgi:hypothetical protein
MIGLTADLQAAGKNIEYNKIRYQTVWEHANNLNPQGEWKARYQRLLAGDIRGPFAGDDAGDLIVTGEKLPPRDRGGGKYESSWIWKTISDSDEPQEYIRVQWAKASAHNDRWAEELVRVRLEMRQTLTAFTRRAEWWLSQRTRRTGMVAPRLGLALEAYAARQEWILRSRTDRFLGEWLPTLRQEKMTDTIPVEIMWSYAGRQAASAAATRAKKLVSGHKQVETLAVLRLDISNILPRSLFAFCARQAAKQAGRPHEEVEGFKSDTADLAMRELSAHLASECCLVAETDDLVVADGPPPTSAIPEDNRDMTGKPDLLEGIGDGSDESDSDNANNSDSASTIGDSDASSGYESSY